MILDPSALSPAPGPSILNPSKSAYHRRTKFCLILNLVFVILKSFEILETDSAVLS